MADDMLRCTSCRQKQSLDCFAKKQRRKAEVARCKRCTSIEETARRKRGLQAQVPLPPSAAEVKEVVTAARAAVATAAEEFATKEAALNTISAQLHAKKNERARLTADIDREITLLEAQQKEALKAHRSARREIDLAEAVVAWSTKPEFFDSAKNARSQRRTANPHYASWLGEAEDIAGCICDKDEAYGRPSCGFDEYMAVHAESSPPPPRKALLFDLIWTGRDKRYARRALEVRVSGSMKFDDKEWIYDGDVKDVAHNAGPYGMYLVEYSSMGDHHGTRYQEWLPLCALDVSPYEWERAQYGDDY